ncbi:MAG: family 78 glycoside hydrolase catalytic domain [Akkermansiaceae bacterium]|nr:family 78 glycoside hydrolase catalytic domain [Verrucomicrobiales bacterium]
MKRCQPLTLLLALGLGTLGFLQAIAVTFPTGLKCDAFADPLGVDSSAPRLDWVLQTNDPAERGWLQTAYQVLVASTPELLAKGQGDLWDSGKVLSDQTHQIAYAGVPLKSDLAVWWKVRVWDGAGKTSEWSQSAQWVMGVLQPGDWQAKWITTPANLQSNLNSTVLLRGEFQAQTKIRRATLNICGLGQYEVSLNGSKVTADVLTPGWTEYTKTCLYETYDVTSLVRSGSNAVGILLGNGMYRVAKGGRYAKFERTFGPLQAIARIRIEYEDGSTAITGTDESWRAGVSPMTFSSVYGGEDWDARREQKGWDRAGFDAAKWLPVEIANGPGGTLRGSSRSAPPVQIFAAHKSIRQHTTKTNVTIYDLGQVASHLTRFTVHGPVGTRVRITPSELLRPDGSLFANNYNAKAWSQYTLSGAGQETYTSKFYYGGNRYLQVECIPAENGGEVPVIDSIEGLVIHSSARPAGTFSCSNELFNRIYAMVRWAELGNMMSVISDCPHRERLGWLEQAHLHGPSFRYQYDMNAFFGKIMGDMADCQTPSGLVPTHVPEYPMMSPRWRDAIEWGSASVLIPWQQYGWTGDVEVLRRNYSMMQRYVNYLTSRATNGIAARGLGDWSGQGPSPETPGDLIATALYYEDVRVLARTAELLGKLDEAASAKILAEKIRAAFNATFFHSETSLYGTGSQGAHAFALALDLVAPENRPAVLAHLVADIEKRDYALTVGEVCLPYLLRALAGAGRSDVVFAMNNQSKHPGYGYQLKMGATALCETWNAHRDNSQIQFMLGHIMEWFYHDLAGIQPDPATPGFKHFVIHPNVVGDVTEANASYESVRGKIVSEWKITDENLTLHVVVPPNTTATIDVPTRRASSVTESGQPAASAKGVTFLRFKESFASYRVGSGDYTFKAERTATPKR